LADGVGVEPSLETPSIAEFLNSVGQLRRDLERLEWEAVRLLRSAGASWEAIGDELGITRQAATRRFSHPKPRRNATSKQG
jgi:DNA invertase Pin-like site-specific DNA recombinase